MNTPRTDAEFAHFPTVGPNVAARIEMARDFARRLEEQNAKLLDLLARLRGYISDGPLDMEVALALHAPKTVAEATGLLAGPALDLAETLYREGHTNLPAGLMDAEKTRKMLNTAQAGLPVVVNGQEYHVLLALGNKGTYGDLLKAAIEQAHYRSTEGWFVHNKKGERMDLNAPYVFAPMGELFVSLEAGIGA